MSKTNVFIKFFKNSNNYINNQLEKNLNKLKLENIINFALSHKIVLTFVALALLFVSYLLIPTFYKQSEITRHLKNELLEKLNLQFKFSNDVSYNFFPRPHFKINESSIQSNNQEISNVKKLKIYISVENLFSINDLVIKDVILENANFNLNKKNYLFFFKLLNNIYLDNELKIKNSNVFFKNNLDEVLFINKINELKYFYDSKELKNIITSKNEIFNIPYEFTLFDDNHQKKFISKFRFDFLKLQIENELNYFDEKKIGTTDLIFNNSKSFISYELSKSLFKFKFYDKLEKPKFNYEGMFNLNPFYSNIKGYSEELKLSYLINSNAILSQLLKTEILNNKNIDFKLKINAENFHNNLNFENIELISKIQDGLIDIDNTIFNWKNIAKFKLSETLIFVKDGELVLDGRLYLKVKNYSEIYKYLLTPKFYRKKFEKIDLNFSYNIDQRSIKLSDVRIDNKFNQGMNKIMREIDLKENNLQNKIYIKNLLNEVIKSYSG